MMNKISLENVKLDNGIYFLSDKNDTFEKTYMGVRQKERRIYSDLQASKLPLIETNHLHFKEWQLRKMTCDRFVKYLNGLNSEKNILDIGCGTGWFTTILAKNSTQNVYGLDINQFELEQAARLFKLENLFFIYGNLFNNIFNENVFDLITLNASIQYFKNINELLNKLLSLLRENGEIHILDSPIYVQNDLVNATERTRQYYKSIGFPEMANHYYHQSFNELNEFNYKILYDPNALLIQFKKFIGNRDSPFYWICIKK